MISQAVRTLNTILQVKEIMQLITSWVHQSPSKWLFKSLKWRLLTFWNRINFRRWWAMQNCNIIPTIISLWLWCQMSYQLLKARLNIGKKRGSSNRVNKLRKRNKEPCKLMTLVAKVACTRMSILDLRVLQFQAQNSSLMWLRKWAEIKWAKWSATRSLVKSSMTTWRTSNLKKTWNRSLESAKSLLRCWIFLKSLTQSKEDRS